MSDDIAKLTSEIEYAARLHRFGEHHARRFTPPRIRNLYPVPTKPGLFGITNERFHLFVKHMQALVRRDATGLEFVTVHTIDGVVQVFPARAETEPQQGALQP